MSAKKKPAAEELVTFEELAKHLKVTLRTIQRWTVDGEIPIVINRPGFKRYRLSEVMGELEKPGK